METLEYFKTSGQPQHQELRVYMEQLTSDPFNHFCLNCKQNDSTHAIIWLGVFICGSCAEQLNKISRGQHDIYIKHVFNEQWDDYQLKSLALGGNQKFFDIMQEYKLE